MKKEEIEALVTAKVHEALAALGLGTVHTDAGPGNSGPPTPPPPPTTQPGS